MDTTLAIQSMALVHFLFQNFPQRIVENLKAQFYPDNTQHRSHYLQYDTHGLENIPGNQHNHMDR